MLENTEGAIKNGPKETGKIGYRRWRQTKRKDNTICDGHYYMQTNTNNVNKTWSFLQTTLFPSLKLHLFTVLYMQSNKINSGFIR